MAFIEFHLLQNFSPSNLNRDDTNTPKSCLFGGYKRSRISSQCQKRQIRTHELFQEAVRLSAGDLGVRTKKLALDIRNHLLDAGQPEAESQLCATNLLDLLDLKIAKESKGSDKILRTPYLLYLGTKEISELKAVASDYFDVLSQEKTDKAKKNKEPTKQLNAIFERDSYAADVALFGRMVADNKDMNLEAACQVAHAISTHEVKNEMDFFTAMSDDQSDDEQGSDMMGMVSFNSACYYRYAQINLNILSKNMSADQDLIMGAVNGFYKSLLAATPSGKQNSFAAHNPASYVRVTVRDSGSPWPLTNGFSTPVRVTSENNQGLEEKSAVALEQLLDKLKQMYSDDGFVYEGVASFLDTDPVIESKLSVKVLQEQLEEAVKKVLD